MERTFRHNITYTNSGRVPVADVAASLIANEKLLREALLTIEDMYPGLSFQDMRIVFRRATSDSPLQEAIEAVGNIIFQGDMHEQIPDLVRRVTGADIPESMDGLITVVVVALTVYGVFWLAKKVDKKDDSGRLSIQGNYNTVVQVGGNLIGDEEGFRSAVEGRFKKAKGQTLARRALQLIRPAQQEAGAAIEGGGVRIEPETIAAAPTALDEAVAEDDSHDPYASQAVVIHATDLDSNKTGWAGHLPGVWEKRLPMRLSPTITRGEIYGKREITADIVVSSRLDTDGEYVPFVFHVMRID